MTQEIEPTDLIALDKAQSVSLEVQRLLRQVEIDDFKWLMGNKQGRRFTWRLLEKAGVFRSSFHGDGLHMAFSEGMRNMGLVLMSEISELCPEKYQLMVKEARENDDRAKSIGKR